MSSNKCVCSYGYSGRACEHGTLFCHIFKKHSIHKSAIVILKEFNVYECCEKRKQQVNVTCK